MSRKVFTLFSDDVRHEQGGKVSYMGVYTGRMFLPAFPTTLTKFCVTLRIHTPFNKPFKKLIVKIYKDNEEIAQGEMPSDELSRHAMKSEVGGKEVGKITTINMGFIFSPFEIDGPCFIKVRVENEGTELKGIGLRIMQEPGEIPSAT
ncbi:DUF6941 family protein [Pseudomonas sp. Z3-8]|uniref:DUF6941 family protein n=1 Tax=Pseudomonas sp. Z3-8 TaxID=2817412 RepID=UPI003DA80DB7